MRSEPIWRLELKSTARPKVTAPKSNLASMITQPEVTAPKSNVASKIAQPKVLPKSNLTSMITQPKVTVPMSNLAPKVAVQATRHQSDGGTTYFILDSTKTIGMFAHVIYHIIRHILACSLQ